MNILDTRTVLVTYVLSNATCAAVMCSLWLRSHRRSTGLGWWLADFVLQFLAVLLFVLRGVLPLPSTLLAVPLILAGTLLLLIGLERYLGLSGRQRLSFVALGLAIVAHLWFSLISPNLQVRNVIFSAGMLVLCTQGAWLLLRRVAIQTRPYTQSPGTVFALFVVVSLARLFLDLRMPPADDLFQLGLYDTLVILGYQLLLIALTFGLVLMVNRMLMADLEGDVAARKRAEERLLHLNLVLRAVRNVNQLIAHERDPKQLLDKACATLIETRGYRMAWIGVVETGGRRVIPVARAGQGTGYLDQIIVTCDESETGQGPTGRALRTRRPAVCADMAIDPAYAPWRTTARAHDFASSAAVPMAHGERLFGVLNVMADTSGAFDDEELDLLAELAGDLSFALQSIEDEAERKRAETALQESENAYRDLVENLHAGVVVHAPDTSIRLCNPMACQILGLSMDQMPGKTAVDPAWHFLREDGSAMPLAEYPVTQVVAGGKTLRNLALGICRSDQEQVTWVLCNAYAAQDASGRVMHAVVTFIDVSERKLAEQALAASEERLRSLIERAPVAISIGRGGHTVYANPAYLRLFGYAQTDTLTGHPIDEQFGPQTRDAVLAQHRRRSQGLPAPDEYDMVGLRKDGSEFPIHVSAARVELPDGPATVAFLFDVSERDRAVEDLRRLNTELELRVIERTAELSSQFAYLGAVLDSASDGIVVATAGGQITRFNPVVQHWLTETLQPADAARLRQAIRELVAPATQCTTLTLELAGLDLALRVVPIAGAGVTEPSSVVTLHDVSQLKALERMRAAFVSNVSHELRTPVTTIKLTVALLRRRKPADWERYLGILELEADRQARLVEDILQVSRIESGRLQLRCEPLDLGVFVRAITESFQALAERHGLALVLGSHDAAPTVPADSDRLMEIANNLIENATRYSPAGGRIVVSAGQAEFGGGAWAYFRVSDSGMGIPPDELPLIFERFYRGADATSKQISGTGLGLAIVKELVQLHGGHIVAESEVGIGTTMTVYLPLA